MPQNGVRGIAQTPDGYLWFTTFDGLVRFDGVKFTVFDKNNSPGILSNRFYLLYADAQGRLFCVMEDGALTVLENGVFRAYTTADGLPSDTILGFRKDSNGEMYLRTNQGNVYFRDGKFVPVPAADVPNQEPYYLSPTKNLWLYDETGLRQIAPDKRETFYPFKFKFYNDRFGGMQPFEDRSGNLWFGDLNGVYSLKDGTVRKFALADGVPPGTVLRPLVEDDDGSIWFASALPWIKGVGLVRGRDGKFTIWGESAGLSNLFIGNVFKDREGTIWVTTDGGLNRLRKQRIESLSVGDGLIDNEVYPLFQSPRSGDIYVGTKQGLSRYRDGKFSDVVTKNARGDKLQVTALAEDARERLWIGTIGDLFRFENGKLEKIPEFDRITVWAIFFERGGNTWIGTEKGLFLFRDDKFVARYTTNEGLPGDDVKFIHQDRKGALWFGTYGGLAKFENEKFTSLTTADGLASNRVRTIYEDAAGTLWIGTYDGGLARFRDGKFFNYTIADGLFNNGVFQILEDAANNFWISCNKGIYRVSKNELDDFAAGRIAKLGSVAYGRQDGMLNTEANGGRQPAGIKTADGRLWFPTQDGIAIVNPHEITFNPNPPPVEIEDVLIDRKRTDFRNGIALQANENNLEIHYTGISFIKPEQVQFRYRIEGLTENWTDVRNIRDVYFPSLPAGEYTFHVIAANSDGVWNEEGARLRIFVNAPFWKKSWFIILAVLFVILIIVAIFKLRERELKRRQFVQQEFSRRLLESQEQERKRIASEMHDSLGQYLLAIKNWALFGLNSIPEKDAAREFLTEVSETSSLAIEEVREIAHNLRPHQLERLGLTNTLEYLFKNFGNSSASAFAYQVENIDGCLSQTDEIIFYRIVQESLNNVIKHSRAPNVRLAVKSKDRFIEFVCFDDGRGFDPETAKNSSKSGLGLNGIAERVKILKGEYKIESEIGKGTKIIVRIEKTNE